MKYWLVHDTNTRRYFVGEYISKVAYRNFPASYSFRFISSNTLRYKKGDHITITLDIHSKQSSTEALRYETLEEALGASLLL